MLNVESYRQVFSIREARLFDLGAFLMRVYGYMRTVGSVTMLTFAGYTFIEAGFVASMIAGVMFFASPATGRLIDQRGQQSVVPIFVGVALLGLCLLLGAVSLGLPVSACCVGAVLMGFFPAPQALSRARWTSLVQSGQLGQRAPRLQTVFSYQGILDDAAYMIGPAFAVVLSTAIAPIAGMVAGGVVCVAGTLLLLSSKGTAPAPSREGVSSQAGKGGVLLAYPVVGLFFAVMLLMGVCYGILDPAVVAFSEESGVPVAASAILAVEAVISVLAGFVFGMMNLKGGMAKRLLATSALFSCACIPMAFVKSIPMLFVAAAVSVPFYTPLIITLNEVCAKAVPVENFTEAISLVNAATMGGLALGPVVAGILSSAAGTTACFLACALSAAAIVLVVAAFWRLLEKTL